MDGSYALIGSSAIIRHVQHRVYKIAEGVSPVLVMGEPGTGKDAIARIIHGKSPNQKGFIGTLKISSDRDQDLKFQLFGCEDGFYPSQPQAREGLFAQCEGGTLFIDDISKVSQEIQVELLSYLNTGTYQKLGATTNLSAIVRLIFSTSADLSLLAKSGQFNEELYYKLSSSLVYLPPLRERREDIPAIVDHFLQKFNKLKSKKIVGVSHDAMNALLQNIWTNNIQELENMTERIVVLKDSGQIDLCDLPPRLRNLVTDNIDSFYDGKNKALKNNISSQSEQNSHYPNPKKIGNNSQSSIGLPYYLNQFDKRGSSQGYPSYPKGSQAHMGAHNLGERDLGDVQKMNSINLNEGDNSLSAHQGVSHLSMFSNLTGEIDLFVKKEIDLGVGIDFYRVVEEFENKLISEALRRTNHNKNRAAQLLSMNRTTLVEKLKKRASSSPVKTEQGRVKKNQAFTIFDGLGQDNKDYDTLDFLAVSGEERV